MALKRLQNELLHFQREPADNISAAPVDPANLFDWRCAVLGPPGTPYAGGLFFVRATFTAEYPVKPPKVVFESKVYHANVNSGNGAICLDVLNESAWSPAMTLASVLLSVVNLLADPNPDDPLVSEIAVQYVRDRATHDRTAREWTQRFAM